MIGRFLTVLQQQIRHDWARTQGDIRINSGVPLSWLRGRSPVMPVERFAAKWREAGVLYIVEEDTGLRVCLPRPAGQ